MTNLTLSLLLSLSLSSFGELIFREDFKVIDAHIPVTSKDLTSAPFLSLERHGGGADQYKLSHHPNVKNDPHYVWNGKTTGPTALSFPFEKAIDLSKDGAHLNLRTKNAGQSRIHLALKTKDGWIVVDQGIGADKDWTSRKIVLSGSLWRTFDLETLKPGRPVAVPDLSSVSALSFFNPVKPEGSNNCTRLDWFELHDSEKDKTSFWEDEQPFLRSALVFKADGKENRTRRGVLIRLGHDLFACFDPDLLRYSAVWRAPSGQLPLTLDSMAGISFPDKTAKASRPPQLVGEILASTPELPGIGLDSLPDKDPRPSLLSSNDPVGPLPSKAGRWLGLSVLGSSVVLHYQIGTTKIDETISADSSDVVERLISISPTAQALSIRASSFTHLQAQLPTGVTLTNQTLHIEPSGSPRSIRLLGSNSPLKLHLDTLPPILANSAENPFPGSLKVTSPSADSVVPFEIRSLSLPQNNPWQRPIRPTDLAFLSNGDALLTTLDGDLWRIKNIGTPEATWSRAASGIFEPIALEINGRDEVFVLGRDQVTQLLDDNQDGVFDHYRCASDSFQQTLHTRDFATSLSLEPDGSFLIAKGGISSGKVREEMSVHRGAILRLSSDGQTATVLADGLRIPYVGRNSDGQIFASDQQGNFVPSTPVHLLETETPNFGFKHTDHHKGTIARPLVWLPYQANRSAAAFATFPSKAFPDLAGHFANVSWDGRLFSINAEKRFVVRLPLQLKFPSLNAAANPANGKLYAIGLGISGYKAKTDDPLGLAEISQNSALPLPADFKVSKNQTTLTFAKPLPEHLSPTDHPPVLSAWNIRRTPDYGSGHFKWNGKPGEQTIPPKATLSPDRKTLTLETPPVFKSSIFRLQLHLTDTTGRTNGISLEVYTTPDHLAEPDSTELALLNQQEKSLKLNPGDAANGKAIFTKFACVGCHSLTDEKLVGPSLNGLASRHKEPYLRDSILTPAKDIAKGYPPSMPSFAGVIPPQELEDLIAYLKTLK